MWDPVTGRLRGFDFTGRIEAPRMCLGNVVPAISAGIRGGVQTDALISRCYQCFGGSSPWICEARRAL